MYIAPFLTIGYGFDHGKYDSIACFAFIKLDVTDDMYSDGKFLFMSNLKHAGKIHPFGGALQLNEGPVACLMRELGEEIPSLAKRITSLESGEPFSFGHADGTHAVYPFVITVPVKSAELEVGHPDSIFNGIEGGIEPIMVEIGTTMAAHKCTSVVYPMFRSLGAERLIRG